MRRNLSATLSCSAASDKGAGRSSHGAGAGGGMGSAGGGCGSAGEEAVGAEAMEVPEELLRALVAWRDPEPELQRPPPDEGSGAGAGATAGSGSSSAQEGAEAVEELRRRHECPVCLKVMLNPRRLSCRHHACSRCLLQLVDSGLNDCPSCCARADLKASLPPEEDLVSSLATRRCVCSACGSFEGTLEEVKSHLVGCTTALGVMTLRLYRGAEEAELERRDRRAAVAAAEIDALRVDMAGASPSLVHRFPAHAVERGDGYWSTPPFTAYGKAFSLRMGPVGGGAAAAASAATAGTRYFCLVPHGHQDRLRCSLYFARKPGDGYKERRVHDWPVELAGHPWGPTVRAEELAQFKQADGSLLLMVHAAGLGAEGEDETAVDGATGVSGTGVSSR